MSDTHPCPRCMATGNAKLSPGHQHMLDTLRKATDGLSPWIATADLATAAKVSDSGAHSQMNNLVKWGFAERKSISGQSGKVHIWRLVGNP